MEKQAGGNALQRLMWASPSAYAEINQDRAQAVLDAWLADIEGENDDAMELRVNRSIAKFLDVDSIYYFVQIIRRNRDGAVRTALARKGAKKRHALDPKQADKAMVRECWDEWQKQPDRYKGKAAFARDMLDKFENLESQPVIEGWCRTWEKLFTTQPAQ